MPSYRGVSQAVKVLTPVSAYINAMTKIIDSFDNRVIGPGPDLGQASSGGTWFNVGTPSGDSRGCDGAVGYATNVGAALPHLGTTSPPLSVAGVEVVLQWRFRTTGPISDTGAFLHLGISDSPAATYFFGGDPTHPSYFFEVELRNDNWPVGASAQAGLWGGDAVNDPSWSGDYVFVPVPSDVVVFAPGVWYLAQWHIVPGVMMEGKIWQEGSPEPGYQMSNTLLYDANGVLHGTDRPAGNYIWLDLDEGTGGGRIEVDYIKRV